MGKIKNKYFDELDQKSGENYFAYLGQEFKNYKHWDALEELCPNCLNQTLHQKEDDINCDVCAENYIRVDGCLRFK